MVIVINMENGERIAEQSSKQHGDLIHLDEAGWVCPTLQPVPCLEDKRNIMPALMEHTFAITS